MLRQSKLALKKCKRIDYYAVLEVEADAGEDAIKRAYRKAALKHHPDKVQRSPGCRCLVLQPAADRCTETRGRPCALCLAPGFSAWLPIRSLSWSLLCVQAGEADREAAEAKFKLVGEANSVLSDPQQRQRYDAGWSLEEIQQGFSNDGGGSCGGMRGGGGFGGDDADLFAHLFASRMSGGMGGVGGGGSRRGFGGGYGGGF
jgi:curved DNA-binding protein CbpA